MQDQKSRLVNGILVKPQPPHRLPTPIEHHGVYTNGRASCPGGSLLSGDEEHEGLLIPKASQPVNLNAMAIHEDQTLASLQIMKAEIIALKSASALLQVENTALKFAETKLEGKVELLQAENSNLRARISEIEGTRTSDSPPPPSSEVKPPAEASSSESYQVRSERLIKAAVKDNLSFLLLNVSTESLSSAAPLFRRALVDCEYELGPDEPDTLDSCVNLAVLLRDQGKEETLDEAEALFMRALEGYERLHGNEDLKTLSIISDLGEVFRLKGRVDDAVSYQRMALNGQIAAPSLDPSIVLTWLHRLGIALIDKQEWIEAESMCKQSFEGRLRVLGSLHRGTIESKEALELIEEKLMG